MTATADVIAPSSEDIITRVPVLEPEELTARVELARAGYRDWQDIPLDARGQVLARIAELIEEDAESLATTESRNVGKPIREARGEVALAARTFRYYAGAVDKLFGHTIPSDGVSMHYTIREPFGVVAAIVPWNFPLVLASWKVAPALAAGNAILVKPAGLTPLTAMRLEEICLAAGLPEGCMQTVAGSGAAVGRALVEHPGIRKISFTGSTEVGADIYQRGSRNFKRLTLELGGKSANLIFADADLARAIPGAVEACFANAGQDCCARSRILVERPVYDEVVEGIERILTGMRVGDPLDEETEMGPLISEGQRARAVGFVEEADAEGAEIVCGGSPLDGPGYFMQPTLVANVTPAMRIMPEEIFGPVAAVHPFDNEAGAVEVANASHYGLSRSLWTGDAGRALRVARALETGVVSVNSNSSVHVTAPFGGVKSSGLGRELGMAALEAYTELKTVFQQA